MSTMKYKFFMMMIMSSRRIRRFLIFLLIGFLYAFSTCAIAGVYECINAKGESEFRDKPCDSSREEENFLPISYVLTDPKEQKKHHLMLKKEMKKNEAERKKTERQNNALMNKKIQAKLKEQKRQLRCERLDEKISAIEDNLRRGVKLKTLNRLKEEKAHCEKMKLRYCSSDVNKI